jgi:hypothetical protein
MSARVSEGISMSLLVYNTKEGKIAPNLPSIVSTELELSASTVNKHSLLHSNKSP